MWRRRRRRRQPNSHRDAGFLRCRFDAMPFEMQRWKSLIFIHVYRNKLLFTVAKLAVDRRFFLSLSLLFQLFVPQWQCTREINFALSIFQTRKESVFKCAPIRIVTWIIGRTKSKAKQQQFTNKNWCECAFFFLSLLQSSFLFCISCILWFASLLLRLQRIYSYLTIFLAAFFSLYLSLARIFSTQCAGSFALFISAQLIISRIQLHCDCIEIYFTEVIYFKSLLEKYTRKIVWHRYRNAIEMEENVET